MKTKVALQQKSIFRFPCHKWNVTLKILNGSQKLILKLTRTATWISPRPGCFTPGKTPDQTRWNNEEESFRLEKNRKSLLSAWSLSSRKIKIEREGRKIRHQKFQGILSFCKKISKRTSIEWQPWLKFRSHLFSLPFCAFLCRFHLARTAPVVHASGNIFTWSELCSLRGLKELRVVLVVVVVVVVVFLLMCCFYLPGHPTKTFAKQLLLIWKNYELLLIWASRNSGYFQSSGTSKVNLWGQILAFRVTLGNLGKKQFFAFLTTRISGYFPDFRDVFDFRGLFEAFRVTLGKMSIITFDNFRAKTLWAKQFSRSTGYFPDFRDVLISGACLKLSESLWVKMSMITFGQFRAKILWTTQFFRSSGYFPEFGKFLRHLWFQEYFSQ